MTGIWPFVGRQRELARAETLLDAGIGVLIVGPSGVGKSALARQIATRAAATGRAAAIVEGRRGTAAVPYEPFAAVLTGRQTIGGSTPAAPYDVASQVVAALGARAVLVVDDAHLLDKGSGHVLGHLAVSGTVSLVLAANRAALPSEVERLWRDGRCERFDLDGLSDGDVGEALAELLGGVVEPRSRQTLFRRSQGNPLLLRELVLAAQRTATLTNTNGAWRLDGEPPLSEGVRDLVAARFGVLDEHLAIGLETIAAGEPLQGDLAAQFVEEGTLEELERLRLIAVRDGLGTVEVSTAHPLYGEVIRDGTPRLRLRRLRLELARQIEKQPSPPPYDLVRAGLWRLEVGQADDTDQLIAAARAARGFGLDVAERLARAAYDASGSVAATLLLAEVLTHAGRAAEATVLLEALPPEQLSAADREAVAYCRAVGEGLMIGDAGGAAEIVAGVLAGDASASGLLRAVHSSLLAFDSRFAEALAVGAPLIDDPEATPVARVFAGVGVVGAAYWLGDAVRAVTLADRLRAFEPVVRAVIPFGIPSIDLMSICAVMETGDLNAAEQRALAMRALAATAQDPFAMPRAEYCLGRIGLLRGQLEFARRQFELCIATITPFDRAFLRHLATMVARSAAAAGDVAGAKAVLDSAADAPRMKPYEPEWQLARAAVLAAQLRMQEAADLAAWIAGVGASHDQWNVVVMAGLDAARYGAAARVRELMREAASRVEGALAATCLAYVEALAARDGTALDGAGARFAGHGMHAIAAEAAAEAALAHAQAGEVRESHASARAFAVMRDSCPGVVFPWLIGAATSTPLTLRERQVAWLASRDCPDSEIASRLGISVRTVQTHLSHVYDKLGVRGRRELAAALG